MKLTPQQEEVLALVRERRVDGEFLNGRWVFIRMDTRTTVRKATLNALIHRKLISISYYNGGRAGVNAL